MPNNSGFSLEDIQLPEEDKQKPVEIKADLTPPADPPEPPAQDPPTPPAEPEKTPVEGEQPEPPPTEDKPTEGDPPAPTPEVPPATDPKAPPEPPAQLTPFHEHPDWKKMQLKVEEAQRQAQEAQKQLEESKRAADPYTGMTAEQVAEAKVREEAQKTPFKDELAVSRRYSEILTEEKTKRQMEADQQLSAQQTEIRVKVAEKFTELGITDTAEQEKVRNLVIEWGKKSPVDYGTFDIAAENLRLRGEIKPKAEHQSSTPPEPPAPTGPSQSAESKEKERLALEAKKKANSQISQGKSSGEEPTGKKPSLEYLRSRSLDEITNDLAKQL